MSTPRAKSSPLSAGTAALPATVDKIDARPPAIALLPKFARELAQIQTDAAFASIVPQLLELLPVATYTCDADGRITGFNAAAVQLWGRAPTLGVTQWCGAWKIMSADGSPLTVEECLMVTAVKEGRAVTGEEMIMLREDGSRCHVLPHPRPLVDAAGKPVGAINVLIDITERRRSEAAVLAAAQRLSFAMDAARMGDWTWDAITNRLRITGRAAEIIGIPAGAEISREALEGLVHPDDRPATTAMVETAIKDRTDYDMEYRLRQPSGLYSWVAVKGRGVFDRHGKLQSIVGILQDIDSRKGVELALRESEARLRLATKSGKMGVWDWDIVGDRVHCSDSMYELHGIDRAAFGGRAEDLAALVHPEDRKPVERAIQSTLEHNVPYELEFRAVKRSGSVIWIYTTAVLIREAGRPVRLLGTSIDITARKQSELALRESEARFRALASHAPVGIFLTDVHGDGLFVNETWRTLAGLPSDQARGRGWIRALHPEDRDRVVGEWYGAVQARKPFAGEYRFQRPDGGVSWLQGTAVEFRAGNGSFAGYLGSVVDITSRKAAEDGLRASEGKFRTLASHAPVGIFLTDPEGETVFVNESWCTMTGLAAEEARGQGWARAMHPDDRARVATEWGRAVVENRASSAEYRFVRQDGTTTWVQGNAVQLHDNARRLIGYIGTVADLTQRKAAEEQLHAREAQFRLITTNAPIILAQCDRQQRYVFVNRAFTERYQQWNDAVVGRTIRDVLGAEAHAMLTPYIERVLAGETFSFELEIPYRDIPPRFMRAAYTPDFAADGSVRGFLCAVSDLSERRQVELALRQSESRYRELANDLEQRVAERTSSLREAIVQMEEFSYSVSHDLRAPLRAMNAYAHALVEDYGPGLDATARGYLDRIKRSSARMEKLTHDMLSYSRVARAEMELRPVNLEALLQEILLQYRELQAPAARVEIQAPLASVMAHETSLGQCFANLLTNAAKFVAPGVQPHIRIRAERTGNRARLWIEDNGIGIAPEAQSRLFRVFERIPTRHPYAGTGIGLAIVRKAVEKMGGSCGMLSDGMSGSRFWIELPTAS